ncbi:MAG: hypothetical protein ACR2J8_04855, partial [Thermomicrobiales bacterium]
MIVIALVSARRVYQIGPIPTGLDGGEWLAIGRGLLGGPGRQTNGAYAPLVPMIAALLARLAGPVSAIDLLASLTLPILLIAVAWIALPELGVWLTAGLVLVLASAGAVTEPVAFGGYPQHLAFAALLTGLGGASAFLAAGGRKAWFTSTAGFALAALCHHIYFPLGLFSAIAVLTLWAAMCRPKGWRTRAIAAASTFLPGLVLATPTLLAFRAAGYAPPLEAAPFPLLEAWRYATREATSLWTALVLLAPIALWMGRKAPTPRWFVSAGLLAASGVGFLGSSEPRLVPAILTAALLADAGGIRALRLAQPRTSFPLAVVGTAALAILVYRGDGEAFAYFRFYRVLDHSTIAAAHTIETMP